MSPSISSRLLLTQSDARLVALAREGHERAFEALVQRYRRQLLAYCRRLLLPSERAEDALQQALLGAWLALQRGVEVHDARPWLYRIVHNAAANMLRVSGYDHATLSETLQGAGAPEEDLDRRIAVREALAGLAALPEMQRQALMRTAVEGHSHEQAAHALGLSEGSLRGLIYRARATLRTAASALTPSPLLHWLAAPRAATPPSMAARLAELAGGGGSLGASGLLLKGGAIVVSAGVLAGGIAAVHRQPPSAAPAGSASAAAGEAGAASQPPVALEQTGAANDGGQRPSHLRGGHAPSGEHRPTGAAVHARAVGTARQTVALAAQPRPSTSGSGNDATSRPPSASGKDTSGQGSKDGSGSSTSDGGSSQSTSTSSDSGSGGSAGSADGGSTSGSSSDSGQTATTSSDGGSESGSGSGDTSSLSGTSGSSSSDGGTSSGGSTEPFTTLNSDSTGGQSSGG